MEKKETNIRVSIKLYNQLHSMASERRMSLKEFLQSLVGKEQLVEPVSPEKMEAREKDRENLVKEYESKIAQEEELENSNNVPIGSEPSVEPPSQKASNPNSQKKKKQKKKGFDRNH